jgi:nucleoside phosphorylase
MLIACVSAAGIEIEWLLSRLKAPRKCKVPSGKMWLGELASHRVALFCCGIGPEQARRSLQCLTPVFQPERMYHLGVCGSLTDSFELETPVAASAVVSSYAGEQQTVELELPGVEKLKSAVPELSVKSGILLTHHLPVLSDEERKSLNQFYGADCVDMEAWEVASFCRVSGVPLTVIKTVSDMADSNTKAVFLRHVRQAAQTSCRLVHGLILKL